MEREPSSRPRRGGPSAATPLGDPAQPTYGKASRIVLNDTLHVATLSGAASLWQEASSLAADDITINDAERTLVATGNVRVVMPPPSTSAAHAATADKSAAPTPTKAELTGNLCRDRPAARSTARRPPRPGFDGGVVFTRGAWRASAAAGTVFLDKERKIEHVELSGDVAFRDAAAGRSGQGDRALDYPAEGRTVLEGKPARVTDANGGNRVAGATLTITERGRRVEVTAPEGGKTETFHKTKRD